MNKMFSFIFMSFFIACNQVASYHTELIINNKTGKKIDSVTISIQNVYIKMTDIAPGEKAIRKLEIPNDKIKQEDAFLLHIYVKDSLRKSGTFGYFENTADIQDRYDIMIYDNFNYKEILSE